MMNYEKGLSDPPANWRNDARATRKGPLYDYQG